MFPFTDFWPMSALITLALFILDNRQTGTFHLTVKTLMKCRIVRHFIRICTVCKDKKQIFTSEMHHNFTNFLQDFPDMQSHLSLGIITTISLTGTNGLWELSFMNLMQSCPPTCAYLPSTTYAYLIQATNMWRYFTPKCNVI